jgi:hypothetical protein
LETLLIGGQSEVVNRQDTVRNSHALTLTSGRRSLDLLLFALRLYKLIGRHESERDPAIEVGSSDGPSLRFAKAPSLSEPSADRRAGSLLRRLAAHVCICSRSRTLDRDRSGSGQGSDTEVGGVVPPRQFRALWPIRRSALSPQNVDKRRRLPINAA